MNYNNRTSFHSENLSTLKHFTSRKNECVQQ
jgi:hypothetical protein